MDLGIKTEARIVAVVENPHQQLVKIDAAELGSMILKELGEGTTRILVDVRGESFLDKYEISMRHNPGVHPTFTTVDVQLAAQRVIHGATMDALAQLALTVLGREVK